MYDSKSWTEPQTCDLVRFSASSNACVSANPVSRPRTEFESKECSSWVASHLTFKEVNSDWRVAGMATTFSSVFSVKFTVYIGFYDQPPSYESG